MRVTCEARRPGDDQLLLNWLGEPELACYLHREPLPLSERSKQRLLAFPETETVWMVRVDGTHPVGFVRLRHRDSYQLLSVAIAESKFRRKGVGISAVRQCLDAVTPRLPVYAKVYADNVAAQQFLRKVGFTVSQSAPESPGADALGCLWMVLE